MTVVPRRERENGEAVREKKGEGKDEGSAGEREVGRRSIGVKWDDSRQRGGLLLA